MFNFLQSLDPSHSFWGGFAGYTKQICFKDLNAISKREQMKEWWRNQIPFWGVNGRSLFNYWKAENIKEVEKFNADFDKKLQKSFGKLFKS